MTTTPARRVAIVSRRGSLPSLASSRPQPILWVSSVRFYPLSCSPFQAAGTEIPCSLLELFSMAAVGHGRRHDHENDG